MRRLLLCLVVAAGALTTAPAALADGPMFFTQGGAGVLSHNGAFHYVAVPDGTSRTLLEKIEVPQGRVWSWLPLAGSWATPALGSGASIGEGLSRDGRTVVLASTTGPGFSPSRFVVIDTRLMRVVRRITLRGSFSFDALSPNGARLYLIQYGYGTQGDLNDYIVRDYDLRANRLLPGRIADRTQKDWAMHGSPVARTYSAGGRWVYTLYTNPGGYPFVHALDTVRGKAHCIKLPWEEDRNQDGLWNLVLAVHDGGRTLAVHWRNGRPWLRVAVGSWRVSYPRTGFPWGWVGGGVGGFVVLAAGGVLLLRRRRGEELEQHPGHELGLA
jgi:hypothetical protein